MLGTLLMHSRGVLNQKWQWNCKHIVVATDTVGFPF